MIFRELEETAIGGVREIEVFLKISQSLQEKDFAGVSFLIWSATLLKKKLQRRCFSVSFTKFLITPFL